MKAVMKVMAAAGSCWFAWGVWHHDLDRIDTILLASTLVVIAATLLVEGFASVMGVGHD